MPDYKKMYYMLFNAQMKAKEILEQGEKQTEAIFIDGEEVQNWPATEDGQNKEE